MISRRGLLGGLSLLPLAAALEGCAARAAALTQAQADAQAAGSAGQSSTSIPVVGPGPRWNGQALSGGAPPTNPARTTAKPAIHWLIPSELRLVNNITIGVDADANGGVKQVDFWVEGQIQTVTAPSIYTDTDANGKSRSRYGYWIALNAPAFKIISTTGEARIFATAVPNDSTMQSRVIGYDLARNSDGSITDGNYPMSVFPRAAANDWSKTVRLDGGGDYTSISAALAAARAANAEAPLITITQTGAYELTNAGSQANAYGGGKGFCTITAASGVSATLGRAAAFTPNSPSSWNWTPGWDGIEFRGSGIVFDQKNWAQILFNTKPHWMNGCKFTNSVGTLYSFYWNGGPHPGYGSSVAGYWDDAFIEFNSLQGALGGQRYVRGCAVHQYASDIFTGTHYVANNYVRGFNYQFFVGTNQGTTNYTAISITGPAGATVAKDAQDVQGGHLILKVNGAQVAAITLGYYTNDPNPTIDSVVAAINAIAGWSASSKNSRGTMRPSQIGTSTGPGSQTFADTACSTTLNLNAGIDIHGDWWQGYCAANARENVIIRGNVTRDSFGVNSAIFGDDGSNGGRSWDHIIKGNIWDGPLDPNGLIPTYGQTYFNMGGTATSHFVFENNNHVNVSSRNQAVAGDTVYSSIRNNILGGVNGPSDGSSFTNDAPFINNFFWLMRGVSPISGGKNSGNVQYGSAATYDGHPGDTNNYAATDFHNLFRDAANGDYRPKAGGTLLSHLVARTAALDSTGLLFAATDVIGAISSSAGAPSYPF